MSDAPETVAAPPAVITVYADGRIVLTAGVTLGAVLDALERARRAVLGITLADGGAP